MMNKHHSLLSKSDFQVPPIRGLERRASTCSSITSESVVLLAPCKATSKSPKRLRPCPSKNRSTTEQIIPSQRRLSYDSSKSTYSTNSLSREAVDEDLTMRLLLLAPHSGPSQGNRFESGDWDLEKSQLDLYSHSGSVNVELIRLPGASNHHFCLYATSCQESVRVVLPSKFRGTVYTNTQDQARSRLHCSKQLRKLIDEGSVSVNPMHQPTHEEDEVHIHAGKNVQLMLPNEGAEKADVENETPVWIVQSKGRIGRLRRIFKARNQ